MNADWTKRVKRHKDGSISVKFSNKTAIALLDYFFFNVDDKPYFDGEGKMEGIDGVPPEIFKVVEEILTVKMNRHEWAEVLQAIYGTADRRVLMAQAERLAGDI